MEEVDIIDAHDNIIGKDKRLAAHKKKLLHRGICVLLFNMSGDIFVQQRSASKDTFPSLWEGGLSGHVQAGETPHQAALREIREELALALTPKNVCELARFGFDSTEEKMLVTLYTAKDIKKEPIIDRDEVQTGEFWAIEKLENELKLGKKKFHPCFLKA